MKYRTAYQFKDLSTEAKEVAKIEMKGTLLTQWLYNKDGTQFKNSTIITKTN
jgi:hypothetical protein